MRRRRFTRLERVALGAGLYVEVLPRDLHEAVEAELVNTNETPANGVY
jgi:hypothetical protein